MTGLAFLCPMRLVAAALLVLPLPLAAQEAYSYARPCTEPAHPVRLKALGSPDGTSVLEIEVGGYTPGAGPMNDPNNGHDLLVVGGTATLGGRLEVPVIDPLKAAGGPTVGHPTIDFLTAGSVVGEFSTVVAPNLNSINPNLAVEVSYSPTGASLDFVPKKLNLEFNDATNDGTKIISRSDEPPGFSQTARPLSTSACAAQSSAWRFLAISAAM